MALLKKKPADEYRIPSLAEASPDYAVLLQQQADLLARQSELTKERRALEKQIAAIPNTGRRVSSRAAELLGDSPDSESILRKKSAEIRGELSTFEEALEVLRRRLAEAKSPASQLVCSVVEPEYRRRVAAVVKAAIGLAAARSDYDDLRYQFEAEDIAWTGLGPLSLNFLGDRLDGHLTRLIREHGHNV